jgi:hypothetical protein
MLHKGGFDVCEEEGNKHGMVGKCRWEAATRQDPFHGGDDLRSND